MCGVVACLPVYPDGTGGGVPEGFPDLAADWPDPPTSASAGAALAETSARVSTATRTWSEPLAFARLVASPDAHAALEESAAAARALVTKADDALDGLLLAAGGEGAEELQARVRDARDACWRLRHDLLGSAVRVRELVQDAAEPAVCHSYRAIDVVLDSLGRLEVRGRDSAGLHVFVAVPETAGLDVPPGRDDPLFRDRTVAVVEGGLSFVYKTAVLIGRLGDNVARLRAAIACDEHLRAALHLPSARITVVAHTRWASVGRISQANAHPVNNALTRAPGHPYVIAAFNGDVDNHDAILAVPDGDHPAADITTDARVIPFVVGTALAGAAATSGQALAGCLRSFEGSMAIVVQDQHSPDGFTAGVKGSGQGLYLGLSPSLPMVASEVYGLVGVSADYVRVDGRLVGADATAPVVAHVERRAGGYDVTLWDPADPAASRPLPDGVRQRAEITTEDVDLGDEEHYLAKEIAEAAESMRKTLRGRVVDGEHGLRAALSEAEFPAAIRAALADGAVTRVVLLGQGTAAVACAGIARVAADLLGHRIAVSSSTATEISAAPLPASLADTLVIAVSQSGSTTDTNRTVDMLRARGAATLAVVNRRDSDLAKRADGIVHTSDGRDVEMAVASTKAFYAQVAAGILIAWEVAHALGDVPGSAEDGMLRGLRAICGQLRTLYQRRDRIEAVAQRTFARRAWSVIGSGLNQVAAAEGRIKLSELCYKTVSVDAIEDKKHIDLSAEALVLVCAAGTSPLQRADLGKEIAILQAHGNLPVLITDESAAGDWPVDDVIAVPDAHRSLGWILATAAAHLFSYYCARAIDDLATDARRALAELETAHDAGVELTDDWPGTKPLQAFLELAGGTAAGSVYVPSGTALQLTEVFVQLVAPSAWRLALTDADVSLEQRLRELLTRAVDELTRSIDSVKHQAKTVTVGTSRGDADLFDNPLVAHLVQLGVDPQALNYASLDALRAWAPVLAPPLGATRYRFREHAGEPSLHVVAQTGTSAGLRSRYSERRTPAGSKGLVLSTRVPRIIRGASDGRLVLLVPEVAGSEPTGLTLLHVATVPTAPSEVLARALRIGGREQELAAALGERGLTLDVGRLGPGSVELLLTASVEHLVERLAGAASA
ncbi:SIS domain-containing protein [Blastococcus sp. TML/M2B]|uniref:SIS domain-containing protein n=1 Tax=unclassified Blastococcus TaxID=2619396 RepID=UPI00190E361A|nr:MULTISPECIES: SIS domain-containing protein [unclassified Blastococcus]MBN1091260.1 SIS domain-containing protein [Blastococcus sp. TML/M2B]MBN1095184.1 SIS domain-containing protein [Blastococcus sp. TML/C7B]